jgi:hypothetical protein
MNGISKLPYSLTIFTIKTVMTTKNFCLSICAVCAISFTAAAQKSSPFVASTVSVSVKGDKTNVAAGEQVTLSAKGFNEEVYTLQWQVSADGAKWKDIPKANGEYYETASLKETQFYRVVGRANEGYLAIEDVSNVQAVTIGDNVATTKKRKQ